ncbi:MAG: glycosyltransferase, partial [Clostridia bacterium]|nr:glycosyltransferase [Clostridia bacterium]
MKVVQINAVYGVASTGRIVKGIHDLAAQEGIEAYAAYSQGRAEGENVFHFGSKREQKLHALLSRITGLQGYFSKRGTRELLKKLDEIKPDVVHLHNLHSNNINLKMLLTYLAEKDIATVLTLHDCWFFTGKCCYFTMANCDNYQKACGNCPNLKTDNKSLFFDRSSKMLLDKKKWFGKIPRLWVVGVSDWVTNLAKQSVVFPKNTRFQTIYNGIDTERFVPTESTIKQELGLENKFVALGLAMEISKRKGYDDFVALSNILPEDTVLVLAGLSKEQIAALPEGILGLERTG